MTALAQPPLIADVSCAARDYSRIAVKPQIEFVCFDFIKFDESSLQHLGHSPLVNKAAVIVERGEIIGQNAFERFGVAFHDSVEPFAFEPLQFSFDIGRLRASASALTRFFAFRLSERQLRGQQGEQRD